MVDSTVEQTERPMSPSQPSTAQRIAVIGGGISGLAAAHRLLELAPTSCVTLFESSERVGGILQTVHSAGFLVERSADMFTTKEPWALDLSHRFGLEEQLIPTTLAHRRAFVVHRGRLVPVPEGFTLMSPTRIGPILRTPLLSWRGKMRLGWERFVPPRREAADESLYAFATRRLGREAYERLVQPLIGGIYTADPTKLSMQAAMPEFVEMEREYGSLTRGVLHKSDRDQRAGTGARYGMFLALRDGLSTLVDALASRLPADCVQLNSPVSRIRRVADRWELTVADATKCQSFDALIIATPVHHAARLLSEVDRELSTTLAGISCASAAIPVLGYRRDQIAHPLDGFGLVVPFVEQRRILSVSFASVKFPGRAPDDQVLLRVFIGGACQQELVDLPDEALFDIAQHELSELLGVRGEPQLRELVRWRQAMPQYHLGHLDRVAKIEELAQQLPHFGLAGNAYRGVGIPFCIRSGELAAERVLVRSEMFVGGH